MNMPEIELSSQIIRQRVSCHETIRFFVPENVRDYIYEHELYRGE